MAGKRFKNSTPFLPVPLLFVSRQFVSLLLVFNNSSPLLYYSSPLQFVSTTIRLHYSSSPLLFVSTTFRLHYYSSPYYSSPYYSSPTIRLHYYSSPLLFVSTKFVSTTIWVNFNSTIYNLVDVINNAGKNSYGGSFVSK